MYKIFCPECKEYFSSNDVQFRVDHSVPDDPNYQLGPDTILKKYRDSYDLSPIDDIEAVLNHQDFGLDKKVYRDNILYGLIDDYGELTYNRLCPFCHNDLQPSSGRVPYNIISIVGSDASGLSVYLASLIHTLETNTANRFNAAFMAENSDIHKYFKLNYTFPLIENRNLFHSNSNSEKPKPLLYRWTFKGDQKPPIVFVFYDLSSLGLLDSEYLEYYGSHIKNSQGIIFLVDPIGNHTIKREKIEASMGYVCGGFTKDQRALVIELYNYFISEVERTDIPTAVVINKSDLLRPLIDQYFTSDSPVFNSFQHTSHLDLKEIKKINMEIRRFLEEVDRPFLDAIEVFFRNISFFATSPLGNNWTMRGDNPEINPIRVDEPFLWILYQLNYIYGK